MRKLFVILLLASPLLSFAQGFKLSELNTFPNTGSTSLAASPDGNFLAAGIATTVQLWVRTAAGYELGETISGFTEDENYVSRIRFSNDGSLLAAACKDAQVHIFRRSGNTYKKVQALAGTGTFIQCLSFSSDGSLLAQTDAGNKCILWKTAGGAFAKINSFNNVHELLFSPTDPTVAYANGKIYRVIGGNITSPKKLSETEPFAPDEYNFSPDGNYFTCITYTDNENLYLFKKQPDLSFKLVSSLEGQKWGAQFVEFTPDGKYLAVYNKRTAAGKQKFIIYRIENDKLMLENEFGQYSEPMECLQFISDGKFAMGSTKRNTVLFSVEGVKGNKLFKGKDIPASANVVEEPVINNEIVPDTPAVVQPNMVNIFWINPNPDVLDDKPVVSEKPAIEIQIKVLSGRKITKEDIRIIINGREMEKNKFSEVSLKEAAQDNLFEYTYSNAIPLEVTPDNINTIEVFAAGKKSSKALKVLYSAAKPNLHVLAIGTSLDLQFPKKDAQDFADLFKTQGGSGSNNLFGNVDVRTLIGKDATTNAIKESIEKFRYDFKTGAIGPRDVMLIFISSHGFMYQDKFRIQGDDYKDIFKETYSVAYEEITSRLNEVPCKKLIFLDACFSGGAKANIADINNAIKELNNQAQGVTTFSSCSNDEYSYEDEKWQNGAFTYSIKEALKDGKADKDKNGIISIGELYEYVSGRVPQIVTDVKSKPQHPTMPVNDLKNLPVFVIK